MYRMNTKKLQTGLIIIYAAAVLDKIDKIDKKYIVSPALKRFKKKTQR